MPCGDLARRGGHCVRLAIYDGTRVNRVIFRETTDGYVIGQSFRKRLLWR